MDYDPRQLIDHLRRPEAYPHAPVSVTALETHISWLFFADDRVYKVKKPVKLDFLDYSTLERRRHFCHEEVRLNRRLAPDIYLGIASILLQRNKLYVRPASESEGYGPGEKGVVDYAVEMHRLPQRHMFDHMLALGEIDNALTTAVAERIADFHRGCATGPGVDDFGRPENLHVEITANFRTLADFSSPTSESAGVITPSMHASLSDCLHSYLEKEHRFLEQRVEAGRIREGHGDLHAGNLCLLDGRVVAYDCIEFSPAFRCRDVACEIAFLAMDLDYRGFRGFAAQLVRRYAEHSGDEDLPRLLPFYKTHLALVRAKVAALRSQSGNLSESERGNALAEGRRYAQLAASYRLAPVLVVMCGLPGSGKSWAARAIAEPFEARVLRSDAVRKRLTGFKPEQRIPETLKTQVYAGDMSRRTYTAMRERAQETLAQGRTVVLDATFQKHSHRREFLDLARELGVPAVVAFMDCPESVIRERLAARSQKKDEISDADWGVYLAMREQFETPQGDNIVLLPPMSDPTLLSASVIDVLMA